MSKSPSRKLTHAEWTAEAEKRFGTGAMKWRFVCPVCGHVATVQDWKDAGAQEGAVAFSCVGRWAESPRKAFGGDGKPGPCDYTGGGLFRLNPVTVTYEGIEHQVFEFDVEASHAQS